MDPRVDCRTCGAALIVSVAGALAGARARAAALAAAAALRDLPGARAVLFDLSACEIVDSVALRAMDEGLPSSVEEVVVVARGLVKLQLDLLLLPPRLRVKTSLGAALYDLASGAGGGAARGHERRGAPRVAYRCGVSLRARGGRSSVRAHASDVSADGVGLLMPDEGTPPAAAVGGEVTLRAEDLFGRLGARGRLVRHAGPRAVGVDLRGAPIAVRGRLAVPVLAALARAEEEPRGD